MISLKAQINSVRINFRTQLAMIVNRRHQYLRYSGRVPDHGVTIAYLGLPELTEKNILISNLGGCEANTDAYLGLASEITLNQSGLQTKFQTRLLDFYLTDIYVELPDKEVNPLYFYHLMTENDGTPVEDYAGLKILDRDMNEIDESHWKVVKETIGGIDYLKLYHDLEFELTEDNYRAYYINFRSNTGEEIFQLLDSKRVYTRIDGVNQSLSIGERTYSVQPSSAGTYTVITHFSGAINARIFFKPAITGQIRAFRPVEVNNSISWLLRFPAGGFITTVNNKPYRYSVPEFNRQDFWRNRISERLREIPVINGLNEGIIIAKRLIRSRFYPLVISPSREMYLEVIVMDKDGVAYEGYTNNPYRLFWQNPEKTNIIQLRDITHSNEFSFSAETGFIRLPYDVKEDDRVLINAIYKEAFYEYEDIEMNPVFNHSVLDNRVIFYLRPQLIIDRLLYLEDPYKDRGIYHLLVTPSGQILDYPKESDGTPSDPELAANPFETLEQFIQAFPEKLLISEVWIGRLALPSDITYIDARLRGGGIKDSIDIGLLIDKYPELWWLTDYGNWDGRPFPGEASLLVELPQSLAKSGGGSLEQDEIRGIVEKHMGMGVYASIKYYGSIPIIKKAWGTIDSNIRYANLEWTPVIEADSYNIYQMLGATRTKIGETVLSYLYDAELNTNPEDLYSLIVRPVFNGLEGLPSERTQIRAA